MKKNVLFWVMMALVTFTSCNSNDDSGNGEITIPGVTFNGDEECCLPEEALGVYKFLNTVKEIPELATEIPDKYDVKVYSKDGSLHVGYNDIYFVVTKKSTSNYVKDFRVTNVVPLMTMEGKMKMQHSTPVGSAVEPASNDYPAVRRGWVSFLMNSSDNGYWNLSYDVNVLGEKSSVKDAGITVNALPEGQDWLKSFKVGDKTYYLSLVNPGSWKTGTNDIVAYVSEVSNPNTEPFPVSKEKFTIEIDPRMPDMGNHTSPDNVALTRQINGSYNGTINLTMTGLWRIHLTVKDADGKVVYGGEGQQDGDGFSNLFWDVTL